MASPFTSPLTNRSNCIRAPWATTPLSTWRRRISPALCPTCRRPVAAAPKTLDVASLPVLTLRSGAYANFTRLVFDWNKDVPYTVFPGAGQDDHQIPGGGKARSVGDRPLPAALGQECRLASGRRDTVVEFETDADSGYHDFKDGTKIVLDILAPKTDATAYAPPGTAKPSITKIAATAKPAPVRPRLPPSPPPPSSFSSGHGRQANAKRRRRAQGRCQSRMPKSRAAASAAPSPIGSHSKHAAAQAWRHGGPAAAAARNRAAAQPCRDSSHGKHRHARRGDFEFQGRQ